MKKTKQSAGILLFRFNKNTLQVFLGHPGGPYWRNKDVGAWSIPKGEFEENEDPLEAAKREFKEETGHEVKGNFIPLKPLKQKSGKIIYAWALEGEMEINKVKSNNFEMEWPPKSGKMMQFPEIDKAGWFDVSQAKEKIIAGQIAFISEFEEIVFKTPVVNPDKNIC